MRWRHVWAGVAAVACVFLALSASAGSAVAPASFAPHADPLDQTAKLTASDGAAFDQLGSAVAISGDTMVVGAPDATVGANARQGAAYVFVKPADGTWTDAVQTAKLTAPDGAASDFFGWSVAIDGRTIVVGAVIKNTSPSQGAAYVFTEPNGGWVDSSQAAELTPSTGNGADEFGVTVAISGNTVVVGAPGAGVSNRGAAYVFERSVDLGWVDTHESARLTPGDAAAGDIFGASVGISGDTVTVGAPNKTENGQANAGAAYVFAKPAGGWSGTVAQTAELSSSSPQSGEHVGWSVGISGGTLVAGAPWAFSGTSGPGTAYVFVEPDRGWANGHQAAALTASDGVAKNNFGASVAIDGSTIVVGAPSEADSTVAGAAYSFTEPASGWADGQETDELTASDGAAGDRLGASVSISAGDAAAGAPFARVSEHTDQGAGYVFAGVGDSGAPTAEFTMPSHIRAGAVTTLNADGSLNAKAYLWDLNGDGRTDVSCSTSQLQTQFMPPAGTSGAPRGARHATTSLAQVRLSVVGTDGTTSTVTDSSPFIAGIPVTSATSKLFNQNLSAYCIDFKKAGVCVTPATLTFSVIEATGCDLHEVTGTGDVPDENALVQSAITAYNSDAQYVTYVKSLCAYAQLIGDPANCALVSQIDRRDITTLVNTNSILLWESHAPVKIDGLDFIPAPGHAIVVSPLLQTIFWSNAEVDLNGVALPLPRSDSLSFKDVNAPLTLSASADHVAHVGGFAVSPTSGILPGLAGLVPEDVDLSFVRSVTGARYTRIDATLALPLAKPWAFALSNGTPATFSASFRESNANGLQLSNVHGTIPNVGLGSVLPLSIDDVNVDYTDAQKRLAVTGSIQMGDATLSFAPQLPYYPDNGVVFDHGSFSSAGATLDLPCPDLCLHLFPGVDLDQLHFAVGLNPTVIKGGGELKVVDLVHVHGGLAVAFPSSAAQWTLDRTQLPELPGDWSPRTFSSFTVAFAGSAGMDVPILKDLGDLANAYLVYSFPGYIAFGGGVHWDLFHIVSFDGGLSGEVNATTKRFNFAGHLQTCVVDVLCGGAFGVVSSAGAGACFDLGPVSVGGGVQYARLDEPFIWPVDGCKWSRFTEDNVFSRRAHALGRTLQPYTVTIKAGDPSRVIRLDGSSAAPAVKVTGPGGIDVTSSQGDCTPATPTDYNGSTCLTVDGNVRIMRSPSSKEAVVGLQDPVPGTYTITPLPGSVGFAQVFNASDTADLGITGHVSAVGGDRALAYNVPSVPGEKVTFLDVAPNGGAQTIGTVVGGGKGTLDFAPGEGTAAHTVTAEVELAGIPVPMLGGGGSSARRGAAGAAAQGARLRIATFMPPKPVLPAAVKSLSAVHKGSAVTVAWAQAAHASSYKVIVVLSDKTTRTVSTRRTRVTIPNISTTQGGSVSVAGIGPDGRLGAWRKASFAALATAPTLVAAFPPTRCTVPKLIGMTERKADAALLDAGCAEGKVKEISSSTVAKGLVISQGSKPGAKRPLGAQVTLVVSLGHKR